MEDLRKIATRFQYYWSVRGSIPERPRGTSPSEHHWMLLHALRMLEIMNSRYMENQPNKMQLMCELLNSFDRIFPEFDKIFPVSGERMDGIGNLYIGAFCDEHLKLN